MSTLDMTILLSLLRNVFGIFLGLKFCVDAQKSHLQSHQQYISLFSQNPCQFYR